MGDMPPCSGENKGQNFANVQSIVFYFLLYLKTDTYFER